jgi:putative sterol carrier protein
VIFCLQAGPNRHEHIMESIELFGRDVIPRFASRVEQAERAKAERLAPAVEAALARREPPRVADPAHRIAPLDSGPPAGVVGAGADASADRNGSAPGVRDRFARAAQERGEAAFIAFVRRSGDRRLERTVGTGPGLRVLFSGMAQRFDPEKAGGFTGDLAYELRSSDGTVQRWVVHCGAERAKAFAGEARDPKLTVKIGLADFLRLAGGDLHPAKALLTGKLDFEGDLTIAPKLGEMFGQDVGY